MFYLQYTVKKISIVPVTKDIIKIEETTPIVQAEIGKVEPEIIQLKEDILKVDEVEIKPEQI